MNRRGVQVGTVGLLFLIGILSLLGLVSHVPGSILMGGLGVVLVIYGYISYWIIGEHMDYTHSL